MTKLVVDIGGTYMRLALSDDGQSFVRQPQKIKTEQFPLFEDALLQFVQAEQHQADSVTSIAVAQSGRNEWVIDEGAVIKTFKFAKLSVVNDFAANALGLVEATEDELLHLGGKKTKGDISLTRSVIGSGTGLGLAYITPAGEVLGTHGGHMLPALTTPDQRDIFAELQTFKEDGAAAIYEDALSGNGILNMYKIMAGRHHLDCEYLDTHHLLDTGLNDPLVQQALKYYHEILGQFTHQAVAFGGAYGGLYLTGGITDRLIGQDLFDKDTFFLSFYQRNVPVVVRDVKSTPVFWIKDEFISLRGLLGGPVRKTLKTPFR